MPGPKVISRVLLSEDYEMYPYMVLVYIYTDVDDPQAPFRQRACTGTLIRSDLVLTLASCLLFFFRGDPDPDTTIVIERPSGRRLLVLRVLIHPNFYSPVLNISMAHDFGLLVVESSKQKSFPVLPTRLDAFTEIKDTCVLGGYGNRGVVDARNFKFWMMNNNSHTCGVEVVTTRGCDGDKRVCLRFGCLIPCLNGDLGSPLVCNGVLFALKSVKYKVPWQMQCMDSFVFVFTLVYNVEVWVRQIMDEPASGLEWMSNPWYVLLSCIVVLIIMTAIYCGLVALLQKSLDPTEGSPRETEAEAVEDDEESWYESQWTVN